jgi:hypothetical protein
MADNPTGAAGRKLGGWLKAVLASVCGLLSGAVLMYLTPLVERVVKPGRPVANFSVEAQGLQVTFQNRSSGGFEGWWDFGDGTALEPYSPDQPAVSHTYTRPGQYTAKLSLRSLVGEESDRAVSVQIDAAAPGPPEIAALEAAPLQPEAYAPATFRVTAKVNHADLCVWAFGGEHPLDVQADPPPAQERHITFKQPGQHAVKLAAVQGRQVVEKVLNVQVKAPPPGAVMVMLNVTHEACWVERKLLTPRHPFKFPDKQQGATWAFRQDFPAAPGFQVTDARLARPASSPAVKDVKVEVNKEKNKVTVSGQMVKSGGGNAPPPVWVAELAITQEKLGALCKRPVQSVAAPLREGPVFIPLPRVEAGWSMKGRQIGLDVLEGTQVVQQSPRLPARFTIMRHNRPWLVTATEVGDQVRVEVTAAPAKVDSPVDIRLGS